MNTSSNGIVAARPVRQIEVGAGDLSRVHNAIEEIYDDALDIAIVRGALPPAVADYAVGELLGRRQSWWEQPNAVLPDEAIELVGMPATPTATNPTGPSEETYVANGAEQRSRLAALFPEGFEPVGWIETMLGAMSGGRPVELLQFAPDRASSPLNIRSLGAGHGLKPHMDDHFRLELYRGLLDSLETTFTLSFYTPLQCPVSGGELFLYGTERKAGALRLPTGRYDAARIETEYERSRIDLDPGDLVVFCGFHKVGPVEGERRRVTIGGFATFTRDRRSVAYWS